MREVLKEMNMPQAEFVSQMSLQDRSWAILAGSFPSIVILGLLVYYRVPCQEAARKAGESRKATTRLV